ncbi:tetratricopeptide repeat protein 29 [Chanos chanos]|uniref:Tetratricopeptide repeat protein 29 n=1 Tax=Chanos chanos TaxID=29144 RepID=A0A6J2VFT9_CHACN|nr:tetratricopeptide repeat protein 29 [Chanos chanos]
MSTAVLSRQKMPFLPDIKSSEERSSTPEGKSPKSRYRNPLRHNVYVTMLRQGFHRSFADLYSLMKFWNETRQAAGPDSALWKARSVEEQPYKLETLQLFLTRAEAASRAGDHGSVYESQLALARFFSHPEDKWLSHHFYQMSLVSARKIKIDGGKKEAEANAHIGQVYLEQGQVELAKEHYEAFRHLAAGRTWHDGEGRTHYSRSCEGLCRVYTLLADRALQSQEYKTAIQILTKAYEMAKEAGDRQIEGNAAYRVGLAYQKAGDQLTAKRFLNIYMEISKILSDANNVGKAYKAIAKSLESEDKLTETIQSLEKFAEVSQNSDQQQNLIEAYMSLGMSFNSRGQYDQSCQYFEQAYETACALESVPLLHKAQVCLASARAHRMLRAYIIHVEAGGRQSVQRLISWKESRQDTFNEPAHELSMLQKGQLDSYTQ